jgi:hypothetical protein
MLLLIFEMLSLGDLFNAMLACKEFYEVGKYIIKCRRKLLSYTKDGRYRMDHYSYDDVIHGLMMTVNLLTGETVGSVKYRLGKPVCAAGRTTAICKYGYIVRAPGYESDDEGCYSDDECEDEVDYKITYFSSSMQIILVATRGLCWILDFPGDHTDNVHPYIELFRSRPYSTDALGFGYPSRVRIMSHDHEMLFEYIRGDRDGQTEVEITYHDDEPFMKKIYVCGKRIHAGFYSGGF